MQLRKVAGLSTEEDGVILRGIVFKTGFLRTA
jgi:hypothetical protein